MIIYFFFFFKLQISAWVPQFVFSHLPPPAILQIGHHPAAFLRSASLWAVQSVSISYSASSLALWLALVSPVLFDFYFKQEGVKKKTTSKKKAQKKKIKSQKHTQKKNNKTTHTHTHTHTLNIFWLKQIEEFSRISKGPKMNTMSTAEGLLFFLLVSFLLYFSIILGGQKRSMAKTLMQSPWITWTLMHKQV